MKIESTSRIAGSSSTVETTTARAVILKQINALQKTEAGLSEELAKLGNDTASIEARIALQQQIQGIEAQIKALQIALLQTDTDRNVQVIKPAEEEVKQVPAAPTAQQDKRTETLGSLVDTMA
jgi:regulator of sirC expression with transglutaminase-like and TPR domain